VRSTGEFHYVAQIVLFPSLGFIFETFSDFEGKSLPGGRPMKRISVFALAMCFVLGLAFASGAMASQKDAKAIVEKAAAFAKTNGKDAALKEINLAKGQFDKDLIIKKR